MVACCLSCLEGIRSLVGKPPGDDDAARLDFEKVVNFLASVPLFRKQLPRSELPKVAQNLQRKVWQPGDKLVKQGETGRAFFLIEDGKALVITQPSPGEPERVRATLCVGDYFGGHTLTTERPNVATIVAGDGAPLVTLSMSRKAFEETGLKNWLQFPKRPAIYEDNPRRVDSSEEKSPSKTTQAQDISEEEEVFIRTAVTSNTNLRALLQASEDSLVSIAKAAERREVPKGKIVASCGEVGQEFFIVCSGEVEVDFNDNPYTGQQSAEAAVASSSMAERLMRKQHFLQALTQPASMSASNRTQSLNVASLMRGIPQQKIKIPNSPLVLASPRVMFHGSPRRGSPTTPPTQRSGCRNGVGKQNIQAVSRNLKQQLCGRSHSNTEAFLLSSIPDAEESNSSSGHPPKTFQTRSCDDQGSPTMQGFHQPPMTLNSGDSFGELSLLYNTRREATFRALQDTVLYAVHRKHFTTLRRQKPDGARFNEILALLEEVRPFAPLLGTERNELACNAVGVVDFKPNERVLLQGKVRQARLWYIVMTGTATMSFEDENGRTAVTTELTRADFFGERSLLRGDSFSQVSVDAGDFGLRCLIFNGESVRVLLQALFKACEDYPEVTCSLEEWCAWKAKQGWARKVSVACDTRVSQASVSASLDRLQKVCHLGRGGWGQVTLVTDMSTNNKYALKTMSKGFIQQEGAQRLISWERELLSMVRSPFVIRLHRTLSDSQHIHFLLEAVLGGSLVDVLQNRTDIFTEDSPRGSSAAFYAACLAAALEHLHERSIAHRDLKPENALLDERGYAKLCDMGFARFVLGKTNTMVGTPDYMAPEMIDFPHSHDMSVDWYALGVLTYELLAGQTPWEDEGIAEPMGRLLAIRRSQEKGTPTWPFHFPSGSKNFVTALLQKLPKRLGATGGATEVRGHNMFRCLRFNFDEFHERRLKAPYSKEFTDQTNFLTDNFGMDRGELTLDPADPLFVPYEEDGTDWDKDF